MSELVTTVNFSAKKITDFDAAFTVRFKKIGRDKIFLN